MYRYPEVLYSAINTVIFKRTLIKIEIPTRFIKYLEDQSNKK